jgi:hypothetical protein
MRELLILATGLLLASTPLSAQTEPAPEIRLTPHGEITSAVWSFFKALRSDNKSALADQMDPNGMITVHNRMDPSAPTIVFIPVSQHLENWLKSPLGVDERMYEQTVLIDGDMAHVWGPYRFTVGGETAHCGINSLSLVKRGGEWKVANTSFTMDPPSECERLGAPPERSQ